MMMAKGIGVTLIDKKPGKIELAGEFGTKVYYGDGLRIDLLRTAGAETAKVIAFCNDNEGGELSRDAVKAVLGAFPQAAVMVRAFDRRHMIELDGLDIAFAERELFEGAVVMGRAALKASGSRARDRARRSRISDARLRTIGTAECDGRSACRPGPSFAPDRPLPGEQVRDPDLGAGAVREVLL